MLHQLLRIVSRVEDHDLSNDIYQRLVNELDGELVLRPEPWLGGGASLLLDMRFQMKRNAIVPVRIHRGHVTMVPHVAVLSMIVQVASFFHLLTALLDQRVVDDQDATRSACLGLNAHLLHDLV